MESKLGSAEVIQVVIITVAASVSLLVLRWFVGKVVQVIIDIFKGGVG